VSPIDIMTRVPDLLPGTLDLLILRTLQKDALHGWAISERIQAISEDVLQINQGSPLPCPAPARASGLARSRVEGV
jgi:DNA-binding PadR family transcriptional regulator